MNEKDVFSAVVALSLLSCRENEPGNPLADNVIDNAGSAVSSSLKSYRGDDVTVNRIYFELIKNDKNLTALNTKIVNTLDEFRKEKKSANYCSQAIFDRINCRLLL